MSFLKWSLFEVYEWVPGDECLYLRATVTAPSDVDARLKVAFDGYDYMNLRVKRVFELNLYSGVNAPAGPKVPNYIRGGNKK